MQGVDRLNAVLLQDASAFCLLAGAGVIRTADVVYIGRRVPLRPASVQRIAMARRWVRLLNSRARAEGLPLDAVTRHLWRLNEEAVEQARALGSEIGRSRSYTIVRGIIRDDALLRYFQGAIVRSLPNAPLLGCLADDLRARHASVTVVAGWDSVAESEAALSHRAARFLTAWRASLFSAAVPVAYFLRRIRHGWQQIRAERRQVALPVVRGMKPASVTTAGVQRPQDDGYLYGASFAPGDIVHVFSDWRLDAQSDADTRQALQEQRLPFVSRDLAGFDRRMSAELLRAFVGALRLLRPRAWTRLDARVLAETPKALYTYLKKHGECLLAPAAVVVVRDDYNPGHVIGTIVCHARGSRAIGIQHVASTCDAPQLAFIHLDRHAVFAPMLVRPFRAFWPEEMLERVGRKSIDWVADVAKDPSRRAAVQRRWRDAHPAEGPVILVLFPGEREICLARQWDEMYNGLMAFTASGERATIVLRFRNTGSLGDPKIARFARLPERDPRFVVEMSAFTTYELIAISEFVIAPEASFTINEAAAAGVPVVTFEYVGTATRYFGQYGRDVVLRSASDVDRVLRAVTQGAPALDCNWTLLSTDANYFTDGRNRERLQQAVRRLVDGAPATPAAAPRLPLSA